MELKDKVCGNKCLKEKKDGKEERNCRTRDSFL